ncbi:MAG: hypothetical protein JW892_08315 [Anaerolineae bacterium]|nr:hypothetical protein [Anaerolineae bacterium]
MKADDALQTTAGRLSQRPLPGPLPLIGVDGGGSKTLALVATLEGQIIGRALAGPSNYHAVGLEAATTALESAIRAALETAGYDPVGASPGALCLGLAGMGRPEDRANIKAWAAETFPDTPVTVVTDAQLVLAAGTPKGWGIALISGTGSLAYGEAPDGRSARAGGWGYLLGDEGSGYAIGLAALRAVTHAADGRGPQTALTSSLLAHWKLSQPQNLVQYVYASQRDTGRAEIAALAPLVEAAAEASGAGDAVARAILRQAGQELALALKAVAQQLGLVGSAQAIPCALAGSVLVQGRRVTAVLLEAVAEMGLALDPVTLVAEPALGALKLAKSAFDTKEKLRR